MSATDKSQQQLNLIDLPIDVHQTIINQLLLRESLWTPRYANSDFGRSGVSDALERKCRENYGERTDDEDQCANALLNWSTTCRHFRSFISPELFKTMVLRSKPNSVASVLALRETRYWAYARNLIFAGTWKQVEEEYDAESAQNEDEDNASDG